MLRLVADHLWQSTICAIIAWGLTVALRQNRASVRHGIWLAASLKFLIPFAMISAIRDRLGAHIAVRFDQPAIEGIVRATAQPFADSSFMSAMPLAPATHSWIGPVEMIVAIWASGAAAVVLSKWRRWRYVASVVRSAARLETGVEVNILRRLESVLGLRSPIEIVSWRDRTEPAIFGIRTPRLLWPESISARLTPEQIEGIIAHEVFHVRRHDNLWASLHMLVEALFWFHPCVWWIGSRLIDERERACDEAVVGLGSRRTVYAESILKTCDFCLRSPMANIAGIAGSDLKRRIEQIVTGVAIETLNTPRRLLLAVSAMLIASTPLLLRSPIISRVSAQTTADRPSFEVASIKVNRSGGESSRISRSPGRFEAINVTLRAFVRRAYMVQDFQLSEGPPWITTDRFDISAKTGGDGEVPVETLQLMLQSLLAERFRLVMHKEVREIPVYALVASSSNGQLGPRLYRSTVDCEALEKTKTPPPPVRPTPSGEARPVPNCRMRLTSNRLIQRGATVPELVTSLSAIVNRWVIDKTGLTGFFDVDLEWIPDPNVDSRGPSIFTAVQEQLGLKLEPARGPVEVFVMDHVDRPTPD
jgi:uncharacterized protein (TIGR03435 family)